MIPSRKIEAQGTITTYSFDYICLLYKTYSCKSQYLAHDIFSNCKPFSEGICALWETNFPKKFPRYRFFPGTETHLEQIQAILAKL
jgi:hypothetical protein